MNAFIVGYPQRNFINRGFLAGPYCPIYGCGALAVIYTLTPFSDNVVILFGMGVIVTSAFRIYHKLYDGKTVSHQVVGLFKTSL